MNKKNRGFDEMQQLHRNRIGNQMFVLMFFLLFINGALYGRGVIWLDYPLNVMVITSVCMLVYWLRVMRVGAYLPPTFKTIGNKIVLPVLAIYPIPIIFLILQPEGFVGTMWENAAVILVISATIFLIKSFVTAMLKRKADSAGEEDEE